jgi:hypothetical protein
MRGGLGGWLISVSRYRVRSLLGIDGTHVPYGTNGDLADQSLGVP